MTTEGPVSDPQAGNDAIGDRRYVTPCGVYCRLCEWRTKVPQHARALLHWLNQAEAGGKELREELTKLANPPDDKYCRSGKCGAPRCAFRVCVAQKGIFTCPECKEYPCQKVKTFARSEPTLMHDGERMRQIGMDKWIAEQEARRAGGFCYADVRCLPSALHDVHD